MLLDYFMPKTKKRARECSTADDTLTDEEVTETAMTAACSSNLSLTDQEEETRVLTTSASNSVENTDSATIFTSSSSDQLKLLTIVVKLAVPWFLSVRHVVDHLFCNPLQLKKALFGAETFC